MAVSDMKEKAKEVGKQVQEKGGQLGEQVREHTSQIAGQAQEKMKTTLEEQKGKRLGELSGLADAVRQTGRNLRNQQKAGIAQYAERAADQIDQVVQYAESRDVGELLNDAERFARRHPEAFLGGAFILGLVAGRFLKSSQDRRASEAYARRENEDSTTLAASATGNV
jgi:ElaB/YqjD/DUF883 family membrane-anchored ribosome-binding protein